MVVTPITLQHFNYTKKKINMKRISRSLVLMALIITFGQQVYSQKFEEINNQTAIKAKLNNLDIIFEGEYVNNYDAYKINIKRIVLKKGNQVLQDLKGLNLKPTRIHPNDFAVDFNHDGSLDLKLRKEYRGCRSGMFECFIFNPNTQKLEYNRLLSKQIGLVVNEKFVVSIESTLYAHCQSSSYIKYFQYDAKSRSFDLVKTEHYRSNSNPNDRGRRNEIKEFPTKKGKN